jgi:PAS domain S-box-containing protein
LLPLPNATLVLVLLTACSAAIIGWIAHRVGQRAIGFWVLGWGVLLTSAAFILLDPIRPELVPISSLFSSLAAPLMMMGAFSYSRRPEPNWVIPFAGLLGVLRLAFQQLGILDGRNLIAAMAEPTFAFAAAYLVLTRRNNALFEPRRSERFLAFAFVCFGLVELADVALRRIGDISGIMWSMWLSVSVPLFTLQVSLQLSQLARRERDTERESQATARRLDLLLSSENDVLVEMDPTGKILYLSPNASQYVQMPASELLGRNALDFTPASHNFGLLAALRRTGQVTEQEVASLRNTDRPPFSVTVDDKTYYFEAALSTYRGPGEGLRIVAGLRNVTQRVRHEETIHNNTLRLNRAEEIARVGSWEFQPETGTIQASAQFAALYGLDPSNTTIPIDVLIERVHPDDRRDIEVDGWLPSVELPGRFEKQFRVIREHDQAILHFRVLGEVEHDESGRLTRVIGATLDITEQRELEERLRQGKQRFDLFVQSDIVGVFFMDSSGSIQDANPAFLEMVGYQTKDLPLDWTTLTPIGHRASEDSTLQEILGGATPKPYEKEFLTRSGRIASALVAGAGLGPDQAIVVAVDVTERKIAEQLIERHQRELEDTVALRTHELLESRNRLAETERLAAVGTLAAGVAHQINNPIGAILNSAEYALLCRDDKDANEIFQRVLQDNLTEAKRCAQIVRSMLQFSRDQPAEKWVEDLRGVIRRAHRSILPYAADCSAEVELHLPSEAVFARISPIEIEQAIVNALRNSIESSDTGPSVSVSLEMRDKHAYLEIIDNGRGIPEEQIERLFDPFYSTRTKAGGTGLGLSVAHGILKAHGGEIQIESAVGSGTRLVMSLPTIEEEVRNVH